MARTPTFVHRIQFGLFRLVEAVVRRLSWRTVSRLGSALGLLFYRIDPRHRRVVRGNLRNSDLALEAAALEPLSRACFAHFGSLLGTTLRQLQAAPEELLAITRIEGQEHIEAAFAEGRAVIGITGHLGNWELMGLAMSLAGRKMTVIGRELDNPLLEERLRTNRNRFGNTMIPKAGGVRSALRAVKEGRFVAFLLDQDALNQGVFVKFLGRWASTYPTPGMLAARFDLPILPIASRVLADGTLLVTAYPPFHAPATGDPARDAWVATQRMTTWIEQRVRENPGQWFWMHRRFKTQPGPGRPGLPPEAWMAALAD